MLATAQLGACSSEDSAGAATADASGGFGQGADPFADAGMDDRSDAGSGPPGDSSLVRGRVLHAIPNLGLLSVCYDPDYVADDPSTDADELDPGARAPESLGLTVSFGVATTYSDFLPRTTGALTFHGPVPPMEDAGALVGDEPSECPSASLEAVLPLPFARTLLGADVAAEPGMTADAGASDAGSADAGTSLLSDLSVLPTLQGPRPVTLLGSGVALDRAGVDAYAEAARDEYLKDHSDDELGAEKAGNRARAQLIAHRGPLFLIAQEAAITPEEGAFALHVAHLMPDVPSADGRVGELRVCITEGTVERPVLPVREVPGLRFRTRTLVGSNFGASPAYRFRFYSSAEFDADDKGCATTSLPPIAQHTVAKGTFKSGRSYTLAVAGAASPAALCSPKEATPLVLAGCAGRDPSEVAAQVLLLPDAKASN